jgi:hypothetical protein
MNNSLSNVRLVMSMDTLRRVSPKSKPINNNKESKNKWKTQKKKCGSENQEPADSRPL